MKILIIEDDPVLSRNISEALSADGMVTENVFSGQLAEKVLSKERFDCIIMDISLPGKNGYELCRDLRIYDPDTPVLMLTAFSDLDDKIKGFDAGADDYLTKPFYMRELLARVHSLIKRRKNKAAGDPAHDKIAAGDILILPKQKKVFRQGREITLTPREYQILLRFVENPAEIISKGDLVKSIWGDGLDFNTNTIEVYINFLRNKLDKPFGKNSIKTKVGYGYYLDIS